jgi:hypothetical protein
MGRDGRPRAFEQRHLLPRWPSDAVVGAALAAGLVVALVAHVDPLVAVAPAGVLALVQKVGGHLLAWRRGGVERAFVAETSAISFYVLVVVAAVAGAVAALVGRSLSPLWLVNVAFWVDTVVRKWREPRFA